MKRFSSAVVVAVALLGCGRARSGPPSGSAAAESASTVPHAPGLALSLTLAEDDRAVAVEIRVTGPEAAKVRSLRATRGWGDTHPLVGVRELEVRDAAGPIAVGEAVDEERFSVLPLARAAAGDEIVVRYTARAGAEASRLSLHRGAAGVSGIGHAFIVRPAIAADLPLSVRFHAERPGSSAVLATSLDGRAAATVEDLASAVYVAGAARTDTLASGDRATIAFGAGIEGSAAAETASGVRAFAARSFGLEDRELGGPFSIFVIGERAIGDEHDGASTGGALAVWLDGARTLDDGARILLAHEAFHRVFGGAIRVGIEGYEAAWFAEGLATYYARRALFDQGIIGPDAFLADMERTDGDGADERHAGDRRAAEYARGSRYAATLDAAVRARSKGARSLDDVVRALAAEARKTPDVPVPVETFRAVVARETGPDTERTLWEGLVSRHSAELPDGALGPCFKRTVETHTTVDLGFDAASLYGTPQIIRGTVAGSAAERAGVHDGALVLRTSLRRGESIDPTKTLELVLSDSAGKRHIRYKPGVTQKKAIFEPQPCKR